MFRLQRRFEVRVCAGFAAAFLIAGAAPAQSGLKVIAPDTAVPSPLQAVGLTPDGLAVVQQLDVEAYQEIQRRAQIRLLGFSAAPGRAFDLDLEQFWVTTPATRFVRDGALPMQPPEVILLRGHVAGDPESDVFLGISPHGSNGILRVGAETYIVTTYAPGEAGAAGRTTISYAVSASPDAPATPWACEVLPVPGGAPAALQPQVVPRNAVDARRAGGDGEDHGGIAEVSECLQADVAIETDYEYYQKFNDEQAASAYIVTIVGVASNTFERDTGVKLVIVFARVWSTPNDPWNAGGLGEFQDYWNANMQHIERTSVHMLSGHPGGGVAYYPGVCFPEYDYAFSSVNGTFPQPPVSRNGGNWDIHVVTHEWGHIYGAPHTHDVDPPIDTCAFDCADPHRGTLMSYCHICSGGEENIVIEFHARIQQMIRDQVASVGCITEPVSCSPLLRGDLNCDGSFDGADIDPFFLALSNLNAYRSAHPGCDADVLGDMNADGFFDGADIDGFFDALGG